MANPKHEAILRQGVEVWNQWRNQYSETNPDRQYAADLSSTDLYAADLRGANLSNTSLYGAFLREADLTGADLSHSNLHNAILIAADLRDANLMRTNLTVANLSNFSTTDFSIHNLVAANLSGANLHDAILIGTFLSTADLSGANLSGADLSGAILSGTNLSGAKLNGAILSGTNLNEADLTQATIGHTIFGDIDLRLVKGLETVKHNAPSTIGMDTIMLSQGNIPNTFLRDAGIPPSIIEAIPSLISSLKPIDFYSCFISYSSKDQEFAECLHADLQRKGVRCWFAPNDLRIGDRFADRIEESIRTYDKLLIVLSENSVRSTWVEDECRAALEKENRFREEQLLDKTVLFPIKLDEAIKEATSQWVCKIRRERHIGDFTRWKSHDEYQKAFDRLLRDLKAGA